MAVRDSPVAAVAVSPEDTLKEPPGPARTFSTDLNYDGIPDTIYLRTLARDSLVYDSITVSITRYGKRSFYCAQDWFQVDGDFPGFKENAYPNTSYFFLVKNGQESLLALFGRPYETGRDAFSLIRIKDNLPKMVMDQNHWKDHFIESVVFIKDVDHDGRFDFAYRHLTEGENSNVEEIGGMITSYSPVMVYAVDDSLVLNKTVMKKYNEEHYVFEGYRYSGDTKIFWPTDTTQKPRVWKGPVK
jgi:hypothetical protein